MKILVTILSVLSISFTALAAAVHIQPNGSPAFCEFRLRYFQNLGYHHEIEQEYITTLERKCTGDTKFTMVVSDAKLDLVNDVLPLMSSARMKLLTCTRKFTTSQYGDEATCLFERVSP